MNAGLDGGCGLGRESSAPDAVVVATAPGRVNLIGEHTDYTGGLALPMAVNLGTSVVGRRRGDRIVLASDASSTEVDLALPRGPARPNDPSDTTTDRTGSDIEQDGSWGAYPAAVAEELAARGQVGGFVGTVSTTLPVGAGLSSSAALEVALALALGFEGRRRELVTLARDAEEQAVGVPCGLLDQLASVCAVADHALLIDFDQLDLTPISVPEGLEVVVVHSGQERTLAGSAYAQRRLECERAATTLGPLGHATPAEVAALGDPTLRRRARHVVSENARVLAMVEAWGRGDLRGAGALLVEGHRSLRDDFEVSTAVLDELVERLVATPGVLGARLTGGGFGGCVVAFCEPGALTPGPGTWCVAAAGGAEVSLRGDPGAPTS